MTRPWSLALFFFVLLVAGAARHAHSEVDANYADLAALDGVKGIGPTISRAILEERRRHGEFKDWADLEKRVRGVRERRGAALSESGLTVNGKGRPGLLPVRSVR